MGMVLEHQLTACYAAGSLGGTLGRLNESLQRLSRAHSTGSREKPGGEASSRFIEPAKLTHLNQTLRLMADAWQSGFIARKHFGRIEETLDSLKEKTLERLGHSGDHQGQAADSDYQLLAQVLQNLRAADEQHWM